jgi:hypothetical protein
LEAETFWTGFLRKRAHRGLRGLNWEVSAGREEGCLRQSCSTAAGGTARAVDAQRSRRWGQKRPARRPHNSSPPRTTAFARRLVKPAGFGRLDCPTDVAAPPFHIRQIAHDPGHLVRGGLNHVTMADLNAASVPIGISASGKSGKQLLDQSITGFDPRRPCTAPRADHQTRVRS